MGRYFNTAQISIADRTFVQAERLAGQYFGLARGEWKEPRYDVKTLAFLEKHEVREEAFAHLCMYEYGRDPGPKDSERRFYRICLQDNRILDAVDRAHSFIRIAPLLLYIAAHELVHVIRFYRGEGNFDAPDDEKSGEEEKVHRITRNLLKPVTDADLNLVMDCFSDRHRLGGMMH